MIRQGPLGYFPMLAWLLHRRCHARCCLRPRGVGRHSSLTHLPFCLRLLSRDRHFPNNSYSRGYVSDSGHTPFTSLDSRITPNGGQYTTGRLTKPYPGGPMLSHSPLNVEPEPGSNDNICLSGTFFVEHLLPEYKSTHKKVSINSIPPHLKLARWFRASDTPWH